MPMYRFLIWYDNMNALTRTVIEGEDELDAAEKAMCYQRSGFTPEDISKVEYLGETK